jgi:hypothetical protein
MVACSCRVARRGATAQARLSRVSRIARFLPIGDASGESVSHRVQRQLPPSSWISAQATGPVRAASLAGAGGAAGANRRHRRAGTRPGQEGRT